jgi:predicted lipid-binding transport protein (Tim44 family)
MSTILTRLKALWVYEPAVLAWATNGGVAALAAFVLHLSGTQTAAVTIITTALAAAVTAYQARPVNVSVMVGSLATIATAGAAFGLHLPAQAIATGTAVLSVVLGLVFRANLTPTATVRAQPAGMVINYTTSSAAVPLGGATYTYTTTTGPAVGGPGEVSDTDTP